MTVTAVQGRTATLLVQWFQFAGGPAATVTGVGITITPAAGPPPVVGPTSLGVTNPANGLNAYQWSVPSAQAVGDYVAVWNGTDQQGQAVQASEVVTVVAASTPGAGPCETWTPTYTCALPTGASTVSGAALWVATEALYALSGRQFGLCTVTYRPCRESCYGEVWPAGWWQAGGGATGYYPQPALVQGQWFNLTCGDCTGGCSCATVSEALLPGPVRDVVEVRVDGVALVKNVDYRLDDFRRLVRLGGKMWPLCNDLNKDDTQVGTWSVTVRSGTDVPQLGGLAAGALAVEVMKLMLCDTSCALPKPVQSLSRQGVNITLLDPSAVFADGKTGLYLPDLFIETANPNKLRRRSGVYDIDEYPGNRRVLGTG